MESVELMRLGCIARLVICPAREVSAGVLGGAAEYVLYVSDGRNLRARRDCLSDELGDDVDGGKFVTALDRAVDGYAERCGRLAYLQKPDNFLSGTGKRLLPSNRYRVTMWVSDDGTGYRFHFMPTGIAGPGKVRPDEVYPGASELVVGRDG